MDPSQPAQTGTAASNGGAEFDRSGPSFDGTLLLTKVGLSLQPHARRDLRAIVEEACDAIVDYDRLEAMLSAIAGAINRGDLALAAIMTGRLPLPPPVPGHGARVRAASALAKASPDDPNHPGWPAKSPDGKGGQFRPKEVGEAGAPAKPERLKRLAARKTLRAVLRRVLSAKRLARLATEVGAEAVPGAEIPATVALIEDMSELLEEIMAETKDVEAAVTFVKRGPRTLGELGVGAREKSLPSFDAFKKGDLEKRFGSAGDGYEYHHIVEQGSNAGFLPEEQLQSTSNIVKIPRLLHEEITSVYGGSKIRGQPSIRETMRGKPFSDQRETGLKILRQVGVLVP